MAVGVTHVSRMMIVEVGSAFFTVRPGCETLSVTWPMPCGAGAIWFTRSHTEPRSTDAADRLEPRWRDGRPAR